MKVYGYTKDKQGIMEIENSLKAEQAFVGGLIECTALTEEMLWSICPIQDSLPK